MEVLLSRMFLWHPTGLALFCIQMSVVVMTLTLGGLFYGQTKKVLDAQTAFYRHINWRLEPISLEKELKNMRRLGIVAVIFGVLLFVCAIYLQVA